MLLRTSLCLIFVCASGVTAARDIKHSSAAGGSCADAATLAAQHNARPRARAGTVSAPANATRPVKPRSNVHADTPSRTPLRWHSFLPGMFR